MKAVFDTSALTGEALPVEASPGQNAPSGCVKLIVLALGAFGLAGMWLAVFADVGVSVIAILNAARMLMCKKA